MIFSADDGFGLPGTTVSSASVTPSITDSGQTFNHLAFGSLTIWEYEASFAPPLDGVDVAHVSIVRQTGSSDCVFGWLGETDGIDYDDVSSVSDDQSTWNVNQGDEYFCLAGSAPSVLEIPTTSVLGLVILALLLGAGAFLVLRRLAA